MNKKKYFVIFKYFFIFLFCIVAVELCSCTTVLKKAEKLSSNIPFNYPGLRIETRGIKPSDIKEKNLLIICFGDSVTFGWNLKYECSYPHILENLMSKKYPDIKVINSGIGGNTIIDGFKRLESDVLVYKPDLVIINFGLNDGMLKIKKKNISDNDELFFKSNGWYFLPQVNINDFKNYYIKILNNLISNNCNILILGINPVLSSFPKSEDEDFKKKQKEIYIVYNKSIGDIAKENKIDYIDLWQLFENNSSYKLEKLIQMDGIHPNQRGLQIIGEFVYKYIEEKNLLNIKH